MRFITLIEWNSSLKISVAVAHIVALRPVAVTSTDIYLSSGQAVRVVESRDQILALLGSPL